MHPYSSPRPCPSGLPWFLALLWVAVLSSWWLPLQRWPRASHHRTALGALFLQLEHAGRRAGSRWRVRCRGSSGQFFFGALRSGSDSHQEEEGQAIQSYHPSARAFTAACSACPCPSTTSSSPTRACRIFFETIQCAFAGFLDSTGCNAELFASQRTRPACKKQHGVSTGQHWGSSCPKQLWWMHMCSLLRSTSCQMPTTLLQVSSSKRSCACLLSNFKAVPDV